MATDLKSRLILAKNIKMDRNYNNVLSYTEDEMLSLCQTNKVVEADNYSFIRTNQTILCGFDYEICLQANYIAFQNPDYSNKWFFAWIDEVNYKGDNNTEIVYTIDSWSTWFDYWQPQTCFVAREHVNDDTVGLNTIDENLQLGEFVANKINGWLHDYPFEHVYNNSDLVIIIGATETKDKEANAGTQCDGIYAGLRYYVFHNNIEGISALNSWLEQYAENGTSEAIKCMFMLPEILTVGADREDHLYPGSNLSRSRYINHDIESDTNKIIDLNNNTLDGYSPVNKKLLTYPYNYLLVSNNSGVDVVYRLEDFYKMENNIKTIVNPSFTIDSCITPSGSIRMVPENYKGVAENDVEGINMGKFPICNWASDVFTNWLTQNGVNIGLQIAGSTIGMVSSAVTGNPIGIASSSLSIANILGEIYKESKVPPQANGNINCGDVVTASGKNDFIFYNMSIKKEYAQIIDDYFSRFGYKINRVKVPNITGRQNFNFVEIGSEDVIGYGTVPAVYMDNINNACRRGVTIWHSHGNLGNFNVSNNIA